MSTPADTVPAQAATPLAYHGPAQWQARVVAALQRVVDPELALSIIDMGLVYEVRISDGLARVRMTMTSAACPVTDLIVADVIDELENVLRDAALVEVEVVWEPPWSPDRMSASARRFMG